MHPRTRHDPVGLTRDAAWGLTVDRTISASVPEVWHRLLTEWLPPWLGVDSVPQMVGAPLRHQGRTRGRVIGCHVGRRVRMRWTPESLDHETEFQVTLQETLIGTAAGTTITIHQERLLGAAERQGQLEHWGAVLEAAATLVAQESVVSHDLPG